MKDDPKITRINTTIDFNLEKKFRETIYKSYGFKKGNIQKALEEAIETWINDEVERRRKERK